MEPQLGLRVVRGPDWAWGEHDGGEGHLGTVVEVEADWLRVTVQWDAGNSYRCSYRCGMDGKYDLRVYDSAPTGIKHSRGYPCNWCNQGGVAIAGILWKCVRCADYHLCTHCYMAGKHCIDHPFERIVTTMYLDRARLQPRYLRKTLAVRGIFAGAGVVRGVDWRWGDQDGGRTDSFGRVTSIKGWDNMSSRSTAEVKWSDNSFVNVYRMGHKGKVDLSCVEPVTGGCYYPEDLPIVGLPGSSPKTVAISAGDAVEVHLDPDLFMQAQQDHGGWNDRMAEYIGITGFVVTIHNCGDVIVRFPYSKVFQLNPQVLTKVDVPHITIGSVVRVLGDISQVHEYQIGHGGWNDDMALSLGQLGRVIKIQGEKHDFRVEVNGRRWIFNPMCLRPAPEETVSEGRPTVDVGMKLQLLSMVEAECPDVVVAAARAGDTESLTKFLQKYPDEVNTVHEGKGALHAAIIEGFQYVVELLLRFHANVELEDGNGERPLHVCAYNNKPKIAQLLLDAGANVNSKNGRGATSLALAVVAGHYEVMKVLLLHPDVNVNVQDGDDGKTPLHGTMLAHRMRATAMLLEAGANPTFLDLKLMTPLHAAAGFGFLAGMEEIVRRYPQHVNMRKDDGYTPLHVAVANGHADIASLLASHHNCDVNVKTNDKLTSLHIAVHEGYVECVERMVGYGADVNSTNSSGNTPLHLALGRKNMCSPLSDSPEIQMLEEELERAHGRHTLPANVVVALFLVREGANIYLKNTDGVSPLNVRAHDIGLLLADFAGKGPTPFHGSLKRHKPFADLKPWYPPERQTRSPLPTSPGEGNPAALLALAQRPHVLHNREIESGMMKLNGPASPPNRESTVGQGAGSVPQTNNRNPPVMPQAIEPTTPCFLCESEANVKFHPCGHILMCSQCAGRAKKCPNTDCRALVVGYSEVCAVCKKESATVTRTSCSHKCCTGCAQHPNCLLCRT